METSNQRKHVRKNLIYYLRVMDRRTGKLLGRLADITTEGMMLISEEPISPGNIYDVVMALPSQMNLERPISFRLESVWWKKDVNPDFYAAGFKFIDPSLADVKVVEDLIEDYNLPG